MSAVMPPLDDDFAPPPLDREVAQLRVPPHSMESESSVLGGLLLDNNAWDRVGDLLREGDFYRHEHQLIFAAIGALINASKPADVITVYEHLQGLGKAEEVGGLLYLNQLAQYVPSATNIRRYAEIVRERAILRKLVTASDEIATNAFNPQGRTVERILDEAEAKIFAIGEEGSRTKQGFQSLDTLVIDLLDRVQEMADNPVDVTGVPTGFADLDRMTSGLQAGDLVVLAARPSMGKTSFAVNIAEHVALNEGLPVAIFSMEMGAAQLGMRMVGSVGRIDMHKLKTGRFEDEDWTRLTHAVSKLSDAPIFIEETGALTAMDIRTKSRRLARQCPIQIEFGQHASPVGYFHRRNAFDTVGHRLGFDASVGFDHADDRIHSLDELLARGRKHGACLADPGRGAEEDLQPSAAGARLVLPHPGEQFVRVGATVVLGFACGHA